MIVIGVGPHRRLRQRDRQWRGFTDDEITGQPRQQPRDADTERLACGGGRDQVARLAGKPAGNRILPCRGQRRGGIAPLGSGYPGIERRRKHHQRTGRERRDGGVGLFDIPLAGSGGEREQRGVGRCNAGPRQHGRGTRRKRHVARLDRLAIGTDRDDRIGGGGKHPGIILG